MANANYVHFGDLRGYIIDAAALIFERSDGKVFLMNNGTGGSVSTTKENVTISNGWISSPQAIIDTTANDVISYTSNLTDLWMIAGMNNTTVETKTDYTVRDGDNYLIEEDAVDNTLAGFTIKGTVSNLAIEGFTKMEGTATPTTGKFQIQADGEDTKVTFLKSDVIVGDVIPVVYDRVKSKAYVVEVPQSIKAATGKLTRITPIYAENDEGSDVKAQIRDVFSKVKVTTVPGFDQSYKSESSHTIEFQSIAPKAANAWRRKIEIVMD